MEPARFRYMPDHGGGGGLEDEEDDGESDGGCFLDVYVHGARGIHNICIYADQDVYARFSLTSSPGHAPALSTRVAAAGGASPRFDEQLAPLRVRRGRIGTDALKCEVWMRSCAKSVLEDQLLGFALVPLAAVAAAAGARLEQRDFTLSSTDLIHSPAGTIRLSLALRSGGGEACSAEARPGRASIASEVVILEPPPQPVECYSRVEFPDLNVARENEDMAVQCLPFLHLGEAPAPEGAMEVGTSPRGEASKPVSSDGGKNASTTTTASDDMAIDISSSEPTKKPRAGAASPETPTSIEGKAAAEEMADVFKSPMGDIDMEAEQSAMQRQIMEMYVKSMQQFTESLGSMKLPMDLDGGGGAGVVVQTDERKPEAEAKKDGARVFYGSRAFF